MSINRGTDKEWYNQTTEYLSAIQRNQLLIHNKMNKAQTIYPEQIQTERVYTEWLHLS